VELVNLSRLYANAEMEIYPRSFCDMLNLQSIITEILFL